MSIRRLVFRAAIVFTIAAFGWGLAITPLAAQSLSLDGWQQQLLKERPDDVAAAAQKDGDPQRGAIVFFQAQLACSKCHLADAGKDALAPDLTKLDKKLTGAHLVQSILEPSRDIRTGFETTTVTTTDGRVVQGFIVEQTAKELVLRESLPPGKLQRIAKEKIEEQAKSKLSSMPMGQIEQLASRQQFLDLVRYLIELRDGGPARAKELLPDPRLIASAPVPEYEAHLDHAKLMRDWNDDSFKRGEAIYLRVCANCHGTRSQVGSLPQSLRFAEGKFKNGSDPLAMYRTLTHGFGFMMPQSWMVPRQKYDVIHYIREAYLKEYNPSQFVVVDDAYLTKLPRGDTVGPAPSNIEPWVAMDYGPSLINTYEIAKGNFAFKGIAMRLDGGAGGVSRGKHWLTFDHDTLRMAGTWQGSGFIDWNGIHFNGRHQIHPKIAGALVAANPVGPGWAHPQSGTLVDPRPLARDGRPYGPLPRDWAKYKGLYAHGDRTIVSYQVGETNILETPSLVEVSGEKNTVNYVYARQLQIAPHNKPLTLVVATEPSPALRGMVGGKSAMVAAPTGTAKSPASSESLSFDGALAIEIAKPTDFDLTGADYSILARIKTEEDGTIFSQATKAGPWIPNGKALFVRGGRLVFDIGWVGAVTGRSHVDDGKWHDVALTWQKDKGEVKLYVDGKLDTSGNLKPKAAVRDGVIRLGFGAEDFPDASYWQGELAAVVFHQRLVSAEELAAVSKARDPLAIKDKPLAAWKLDGVKDNRVADVVGTHHGQLLGASNSNATSRGLLMAGITPDNAAAKWRWDDAGRLLLEFPASQTPLTCRVWFGTSTATEIMSNEYASAQEAVAAQKLTSLAEQMQGGPRRWPQVLTTKAKLGESRGAFAIDVLTPPDTNPWLAQLRLTGLDFFADGDRAAVSAWDGDVWLVSGLSKLGSDAQTSPELRWQRIATGLFQPLGVKILHDQVYVTCRDQIVILRDKNGDGETDFYECFNNDHQVTEHFHEFAMGLQADAEENLYYAKSARHALTALVPHHGTLLRVSRDGSRTDILANGFRAANGVCLNPDGSFIVTDQEGHWNPKNRINWVTVDPSGPPKFYGNMFGYHNRTDASDSAMEPPLCWITNTFDRSPAELLWVTSDKWGPLKGSLLNLSYGTGKVFLVPHEKVAGQMQGGMIELPIPVFPTGVQRGRFHPRDGQLYLCGMFAWAGSATQPGGFYRLRMTREPVEMPVELHALKTGMKLTFTTAMQKEAAEDLKNYTVKVWGLQRSANYGSPHVNEHAVEVTKAKLGDDGHSVTLEIKEMAPTWCMSIDYRLRNTSDKPVHGTIHNTVHNLAK